jgi:hypothetical protein
LAVSNGLPPMRTEAGGVDEAQASSSEAYCIIFIHVEDCAQSETMHTRMQITIPDTTQIRPLLGACVAACTVYVVCMPCQLRSLPVAARVIAFAVVLAMLLMANSVPLTVSTAVAFAAVALHWSHCPATAPGPAREAFAINAPFAHGGDEPLPGLEHAPAFRAASDSGPASGATAESGDEVESAVARLQALTPASLLEAAQTNEVPAR